jgi:hypothetical protein
VIKPIAEAIALMRFQERSYRETADSLERVMPLFPDAVYDSVKLVSPSANIRATDVYIEREKSGLVMAHPYLYTDDGDVVFGESVAVGDAKPGGDISNDHWAGIMESRGISGSIRIRIQEYLDDQKFPTSGCRPEAPESPASIEEMATVGPVS